MFVLLPLMVALPLAGCTSNAATDDAASTAASSPPGSPGPATTSAGSSPGTSTGTSGAASPTGTVATLAPTSVGGGAGGGAGDAPSPVTGTVTPVVTYAAWDTATGQVDVSAYVNGVQQDTDGRCTLTLTGPGGATATASRAAIPDAATTQCGTVSVTPQPPTPGRWSGVVSYSSATAAGSSAPFTVEVTS